jgi:hypothetical protein
MGRKQITVESTDCGRVVIRARNLVEGRESYEDNLVIATDLNELTERLANLALFMFPGGPEKVRQSEPKH